MRISPYLLLSFTCLVCVAWSTPGGTQEAGEHGACLNPQETREAVLNHHLTDAFHVTKHLASDHHAEALGAKLCRLGEQFIYEVALLPHDGKVLHVQVDATTGQILAGRPPR
jgi:uncharacterized protein YpmB